MSNTYKNEALEAQDVIDEITERVHQFLVNYPSAVVSVTSSGYKELEISASIEGFRTVFGNKVKGCFHLTHSESKSKMLQDYMKVYFNFYYA